MEFGSNDFLAEFLSDLQSSFGAEILDARDDLHGAIVVDVRVNAERARRVYRTSIRRRAQDAVVRSRMLCDASRTLQADMTVLVDRLRGMDTRRRRWLDDSRAQVEVTRELRRDSHPEAIDPGDRLAPAPG